MMHLSGLESQPMTADEVLETQKTDRRDSESARKFFRDCQDLAKTSFDSRTTIQGKFHLSLLKLCFDVIEMILSSFPPADEEIKSDERKLYIQE